MSVTHSCGHTYDQMVIADRPCRPCQMEKFRQRMQQKMAEYRAQMESDVNRLTEMGYTARVSDGIEEPLEVRCCRCGEWTGFTLDRPAVDICARCFSVNKLTEMGYTARVSDGIEERLEVRCCRCGEWTGFYLDRPAVDVCDRCFRIEATAAGFRPGC